MNLPTLTLPLLNRFLDLIISYHDYKEIQDEGLLELVKLVDANEDHWHVEGVKLYRKKAWLKDLDRIARAKREQEEINNIRDIRLRIIRQLQAKLSQEFGVDSDNEMVIKIAVDILKRGRTKLASFLEVDIDNIPDMPVSYWVLDGKTEIKL